MISNVIVPQYSQANPVLEMSIDEDLHLRHPQIEDAQELFDLVNRNREHLKQFLFWVDYNTDIDHSQIFINDCIKKQEEGKSLIFCIIYKKKIIGTIGLIDIDKINQSAEIGYWISQEQQGKGIVRRCCAHLIAYSFEKLFLHRIEIYCATKNEASRKIPEKLGFTAEGTLRQAMKNGDQFIDLILYSMLFTEKNRLSNIASTPSRLDSHKDPAH